MNNFMGGRTTPQTRTNKKAVANNATAFTFLVVLIQDHEDAAEKAYKEKRTNLESHGNRNVVLCALMVVHAHGDAPNKGENVNCIDNCADDHEDLSYSSKGGGLTGSVVSLLIAVVVGLLLESVVGLLVAVVGLLETVISLLLLLMIQKILLANIVSLVSLSIRLNCYATVSAESCIVGHLNATIFTYHGSYLVSKYLQNYRITQIEICQ